MPRDIIYPTEIDVLDDIINVNGITQITEAIDVNSVSSTVNNAVLTYNSSTQKFEGVVPSGPMNFIDAGNLGATLALDVTGKYDTLVKGTLTANCTVTITGLAPGAAVSFQIKQDATGSRTFTISPDPLTPGGTPLAISTGPNQVDAITTYYDGTNLLAFLSGANFS